MVTHILSQFLKTLVPTSALFVLMLSLTSLHAAVPGLINYQGRLTDSNGDPVTGSKTFAVAIYDAAAGLILDEKAKFADIIIWCS